MSLNQECTVFHVLVKSFQSFFVKENKKFSLKKMKSISVAKTVMILLNQKPVLL